MRGLTKRCCCSLLSFYSYTNFVEPQSLNAIFPILESSAQLIRDRFYVTSHRPFSTHATNHPPNTSTSHNLKPLPPIQRLPNLNLILRNPARIIHRLKRLARHTPPHIRTLRRRKKRRVAEGNDPLFPFLGRFGGGVDVFYGLTGCFADCVDDPAALDFDG